MSKQTGYARNIFFSIIISILILLTLGFFSIKYLVPIYDLQSKDIFQFLIYLLPILIGFVFIEIGSIIASRENIHSTEDGENLLLKNRNDSTLVENIIDDPLNKRDATTFSPISPISTLSSSETEK
jgi:hypothetical protein